MVCFSGIVGDICINNIKYFRNSNDMALLNGSVGLVTHC